MHRPANKCQLLPAPRRLLLRSSLNTIPIVPEAASLNERNQFDPKFKIHSVHHHLPVIVAVFRTEGVYYSLLAPQCEKEIEELTNDERRIEGKAASSEAEFPMHKTHPLDGHNVSSQSTT